MPDLFIEKYIMKPWLLLLLSVVFINGCTFGPTYKETNFDDPENAIIYIYRLPDLSFSGPQIYVQERKIGTLTSDGFFIAKIPPGEATVTARENTFWKLKDQRLEFNVEKGKKYFVRYGFDAFITGLPVVYHIKKESYMVLVRQETGIEHLSQRSFIKSD